MISTNGRFPRVAADTTMPLSVLAYMLRGGELRLCNGRRLNGWFQSDVMEYRRVARVSCRSTVRAFTRIHMLDTDR